jgi:mannosyltransferase
VTADRRLLVAALAASALAALLLRGWHIADWPLWLDESWSRWMAGQSWAGLHDSALRYDTHPPFYYVLLKLWAALAPETPAGLRSLSVLAGAAMLPVAWACAGEIGGLRRSPWARAAAVALVAVSPPLVAAAAQARPYALFAFAFALALWAALALAGGKQASRRARLMIWALYLLGIGCTLWLHSLGALFAAALAGGLLLALAAGGTLRRDIVPYAAVHAVAALAWLPALLILLEQRRNWSASTWLHFSFADVPRGLASGLGAPGAAAALLILALALLGAWALARGRAGRPALILLLAAAGLPAVLAVLVSAIASPVFLPRTLVPSVLPLLLLAAAGLAAIDRRPVALAAASVSILLLAAASAALATAQPEEKWGRLGPWLGQRVGASEEVWLLPNEIVLPLRYGGGTLPFPVRGVPADFPAPAHPGPRPSGTRAVPGMTEADAARLVADARRRGATGIWVVSRFPALFDPGDALAAAFAPAGRDLREVRFAPLIVDHYRLAPH